MKTIALFALVSVSLSGSFGCVADEPDFSESALPITILNGDVDCIGAGLGDRELRVSAPFASSYQIDATTLQVGFDGDGIFFYFTSDGLRLDGILAHAGGRTGSWDFGDESNGWGSLFAPIDSSTGQMLPTEWISFCYDYELRTEPNAYAAYGSRHTWAITKTSLDDVVALGEGETFTARYDIAVTHIGALPAGYQIDGPVFVFNDTPYATTLTGVTVTAGDVEAAGLCPISFPYLLEGGAMLTCTFIADVPDDDDRLVVSTVTTNGGNPDASGSELASFSAPSTWTNQIDECVDVADDQLGNLGTVCAVDGSHTYRVQDAIGPFACGPFAAESSATATALETGAIVSASATVTGEVDCAAACTQTWSYWRTHTQDATWAEIAGGASATFFSSGTTYHGALSTTPGTNLYWHLARAYIAAKLNKLSGADFAVAQATFNAATTLLTKYTPTQLKNANLGVKLVATLVTAGLEAYNNGWIGPGRCE